MKIKEDIIVDNLDEQYIITHKNESGEIDISNVIVLENVSAFIFECLEKNMSSDEIISQIIQNYEIDQITARNDLNEFITKLKEENVIYDE